MKAKILKQYVPIEGVISKYPGCDIAVLSLQAIPKVKIHVDSLDKNP